MTVRTTEEHLNRILAKCNEMAAQIAQLREALAKLKEAIWSVQDWNETYVGECSDEADKALLSPPPPVVPLEDMRPLVEMAQAAKNFIDSHVADPDITEKMAKNYATYQEKLPALSTFTTKHFPPADGGPR